MRSRRAGERVLQSLRALYAKLRLHVNEAKTAVAAVRGRKFLGYCLWPRSDGTARLGIAAASEARLRDRLRQLTRRTVGRSLEQIVVGLKDYIPGWKAYFHLAAVPKLRRNLDKWLRHRLRAVQLKQWRNPRTIYRELRRLGASHADARHVAANSKCWWHNSALLLNRAMPVAFFDALGLPRFS